MDRDLDTIVTAYLACADWADSPDDEPNNGFTESFKEQAREDCADFLSLVQREGADDDRWDDEQFGHDFWLTRRGHGTGFWDRGRGSYGDLTSAGGKLTALAKTYSSDSGLYVNDDGYLDA